MDKPLSKILITACLLVAGGVAVYLISQPDSNELSSPTYAAPPVANAQVVQDSKSSTIEVGSPDGKKSLIMHKEIGRDAQTYTFLMKDVANGENKQILTKTVPKSTTISIPFNTFSPDNKYIFLKEIGEGKTVFFAVVDDGVLDISAQFEAKYADYKITDVTGWGGINLIVVNVDKKEGGVGPSFWFDVTSNSFIQLAKRFN